ncbi:AAA family ATPase (plasmid) [Paenibacillus sp. EC2-1]|uniref:AAA family ATPase n=1 Tax=Paenibacillus sp. EC2-1 TaxID=3388665 RepID=UPI003BEF31C0
MKILYWTDPHIMGRNPGARIDNYPEAIFRKVLYLEHVCKTDRPDVMVIGGDLYDSPRIADSIKTRYNRVFRRIRKMGIKIYLVPGNHDLFGYTLDTVDQTAIGVMASSGVINLLTREISEKTEGILIKGSDGTTVAIHGQEFHKDIDKDPQRDYEINRNRNADWNILFSHGMLLKDSFHPDVRFTLTKDVKTKADMVVNGHYHPGYEVHEFNDVIFANPGSTGRDEYSKRDEVFFAMITAGQELEIEYMPYIVAQPSADIFDHSARLLKKSHERYLEAFEQTVEDAIAFDAFDPKDTIQQLVDSGAVEDAIAKLAFDSIVNAESTEKANKLDGFVESQNPISILSIELENFQSHGRTVVELNPRGLNALTGPSDSGKSAIIRALRWVCYNEPKGADFIREGENRATVTVNFSNGMSLTRSRTNSSSGDYVVKDSSGNVKEFKGFGNDIPIDIANVHQMPRVELAQGYERSLNFSNQLDGHFMLSESPQTRAATIGRLTGVHLVDAAIKAKQSELRAASKDMTASQQTIDNLNQKLGTFSDLESFKDTVSLSKALLMGAEYLEREIDELTSLDRVVDASDIEIQTLETMQDSMKYLDEAENAILSADIQIREIDELTKLRSQWRRSIEEVDALTQELDQYASIDSALDLLDDAAELRSEINSLESLRREYRESKDLVEQLSDAAANYDTLSEAEAAIAKADELMKEIAELEVLRKQYNAHKKEVTGLEKDLEDQDNAIARLSEEMTELIKDMGNKCPTCNQSVDADHILEHIG